MNVRIGKLSENIYVTGQIAVADVAELADSGIRTIINNRPDGEDRTQPLSADIAAAAKEFDVNYIFLPVRSRGITAQNVEDFRTACADLEVPVLMFCRSGARSAMLWQLAALDL